MLKHSKFENGSKYGTSHIAMMNYAFDAKNAVLGINAKESGVGQRNVGIYQIGSNMNKPTEIGKWYTFSVEVRGEGWAESSLMVGIESQGNDGKAGMVPDVKPTNGWTRYQTTFKAIKASAGAVYYFEPLRTGAWIEFRSPMLNEGKVTGGYQQAPEDIGTASDSITVGWE